MVSCIIRILFNNLNSLVLICVDFLGVPFEVGEGGGEGGGRMVKLPPPSKTR